MIPNFKMPDKSDSQQTIRMEPEILNSSAIVVHLTGFIDTYNSEFFTAQMRALIAAGYSKIVLACAKLTYISSTGVGAFTAILKDVGKKGEVIIAESPTKVLEVFQLLGFSSFFHISPSLTAAKERAIASGATSAAPSATVFPKILDCPICEKKLKITKAGMFRCPECKTGVIVNEIGELSLK